MKVYKNYNKLLVKGGNRFIHPRAAIIFGYIFLTPVIEIGYSSWSEWSISLKFLWFMIGIGFFEEIEVE